MEIGRLKVFLDLAKTLNYSETAARLFTTQGNISKQILSLEKELGVTLFLRAHRKISLTAEGQMVKPFARKIVNDYESLSIKIADHLDDQSMQIRLFNIPTMTNYDSFLLLAKFLREHTEIHVKLQEKESDQLLDSLRRNDCDIIFTRLFDKLDPDLEIVEMEDDELVAVVPTDFPIMDQAQGLRLQQLASEKFLQLNDSTNLLHPIKNLCHQAGFAPNVVYSGTRIDLIMAMIKNHLGVSLMMKKTVQHFADDKVKILPLDYELKNRLCFVRKKGHNSYASEKLWNYIQERK